MPPESRPLRRQLLGWLLVPLLLLLAADALVSYFVAVRFSNRAYDRALEEVAAELSLHVVAGANGLRFDLPEAAQRVLLADPEDRLWFQVSDRNGARVAGEAAFPAAARGRGARVFDATINGEAVRVVQLEVAGDAGVRPASVVRVAETLHKRNALAREILASVVLPQLALVAIVVAIVWVGVSRGLAPLERLRYAIASRGHTDLRPLEEASVPGEVRPLVHAMNDLMRRLDSALTLQSRFIADAAHQLKTPVAGLRAQLELLLRENDPERMREALSRQYIGVERLARLVAQLLSLARNEPEAARALAMTAVDLNGLALEGTMDWVPEALKKEIDLGFEGRDAPVLVHGDAGRLRELLDNLLDNAIRYSPPAGRVTVRVFDAPRPTLAVSDDGPRIPLAERRRVFERFHRLLGSEADGSGLGLAIAREIARLHGAEIVLDDDTDGVGNTFSIGFPPPA